MRQAGGGNFGIGDRRGAGIVNIADGYGRICGKGSYQENANKV